MNLYIGIKSGDVKDTMYLKPELLSDKAVNLFLASNIWDKCYEEISNTIPLGVLPYLREKCKEMCPVKFGDITEHGVDILCEMFPDRAGGIRKDHMLGRLQI